MNIESVEMTTLATLDDGLGYIIGLHTNDKAPAHIHLYKTEKAAVAKTYWTRVLIPEEMPSKIDDIKTFDIDEPLSDDEKKLLLNWFHSTNLKNKIASNYNVAVLLWNFQNPTFD